VVILDDISFLQLFVVHVSEPLISYVAVEKQFHLNQLLYPAAEQVGRASDPVGSQSGVFG
jgi:hypothetical protein